MLENNQPNDEQIAAGLIFSEKDIILHGSGKNVRDIVQSNRITGSKYSFTVMEKRAVYLIAMAVNLDIIGQKKLQRDLIGDVYMQFTPDQVLKASTRYEHVYTAFRGLVNKKIEIKTESIWEEFGIIERPRHIKNGANSYFQFRVPKPIIDYFRVKLKDGNATVLAAQVAFTLERTSSQRMYEYCRQFKVAGGFRKDLTEFKDEMSLSEIVRYTRWSNLKNDFLEPARLELKELYDKSLCDLYFNYSEVKKGKRIVGLRFKVVTKDGNPFSNHKIEDFIYNCKTWLNAMFEVDKKPKNKEYVKGVITAITLKPEKAEELHSKLARITATYPASEQPKVVRITIKEDGFLE